MKTIFRRKKALGVGLGVGLLGAVWLAFRYGWKRPPRAGIPESISPAIFATRSATTSFGEMVYHTSGSGQPLVFLHGVYPGASSFEWSRVYPEFALSHEVIAPDLIGFGESTRPRLVPDAADMARCLVEFLHEVCEGRKPILVASGLGAHFGYLAASQHPELFARLIAWGPMGLCGPIRRKLVRRMLGIGRVPLLRSFVWRNYFARPPFMHSWIEQIGFAGGKEVDPSTVRVLSTCASLPGAERAIWAFLQGHLASNLTSRLSGITAPSTILWPENSEWFPLEEAETILKLLPGASLEWMPNYGLLGPLAQPADFLERIHRSLQGDLRISA